MQVTLLCFRWVSWSPGRSLLPPKPLLTEVSPLSSSCHYFPFWFLSGSTAPALLSRGKMEVWSQKAALSTML